MRLTSYIFHPSHPRGGHPPHSNLVRGKLTSPTPTLQETGPTVLRLIREDPHLSSPQKRCSLSTGHKRICQQEAVSVICNGNWTEWNVIWSGIVWVILKSHEFDLKSQVWFQTKIARHKVQSPLYCIHPKFNRSDAGFFLLFCTNILLI